MSDVDDSVCPECGAAQSSDGPFCDNCGFRLRRAETEIEGRAISRVPFRRGTESEEAADTDLENQAVQSVHSPLFDAPTLMEVPTASADRATAIEGVKAITRDEAAAHAASRSGLHSTADAPTERHPSISPGQISGGRLVAPALPTVDHEAVAPSAVKTSTDLPVIVPDDSGSVSVVAASMNESKTPTFVWIGLWLGSLVAVAMVTEYLTRDNTPVEIGTPALRKVSPTRIAVPASKYRRGLNDELRANILSTCLRMSDDNSICKQEELLAGEYPESTIEVGAFAIDSLEVTVGEYTKCVEAGVCKPIVWRDCKVYTLQGLQTALRAPRSIQSPGVAATCVDRTQAANFCGWRTGRLPTHDEWERVARGTDGRVYPWGSIWNPEAANWGELDVAQMPVPGKIDGADWVRAPGQYPDGASAIGALDMAGNVAEWVADEPIAARGGSWTSNPFDLRVTHRLEIDETARRTDVGFRCAY